MTGYSDSIDGAQAPTGTAVAGATPLADTAFRRAEKRYQLHYEQQMRQRKGRMRLGKLVEQPTDLSDVVDIRQPAATRDVATIVLQQPEQCPQGLACSSGNGSITALVFPRHPGLVVFPAAVAAELQLQLMHAALDQWPDPPARTNHTKAYGTSLCRLFEAAQQGLSLMQTVQKQQHQGQQQLSHQQHHEQQQAAQHDGRQQAAPQLDVSGSQHHHPQQKQPRPCQACQQDQTTPASDGRQGQHSQQQHQQEGTQPCQQEQQWHEHQQHPPDCSSSSSSSWSLDSTGPKASTLLRKLRWVCLGPPYNWTDRVYEPHIPHTPLPPSLVQLAQQHAELAHQAMLLAEVSAAAGSCARPTTVSSCSCALDAELPTAALAAAGGAAAAGSSAGNVEVSSCPPDGALHTAGLAAAGDAAAAAGGSVGLLAACGCPPDAALPSAATEATGGAAAAGSVAGFPAVSSRSYVPDAALVNYYHSGDTLNGHKDDVEKDLDQPIVTVSLGCDAVFLLGGTTRDIKPTALLLRSGDIVVMGQEARACYHGVPRVLTDRLLSADLLQAAEQAPLAQQQCLQHMQGCRINISIRSTA